MNALFLIIISLLLTSCAMFTPKNNISNIVIFKLKSGEIKLSQDLQSVLPTLDERAPCCIILPKAVNIFSADGLENAIKHLQSEYGEVDVYETFSYGYSRSAKFKIEK